MIEVTACEMNDVHFRYKCPFGCRSRFHKHGNCGDTETDRIEYRLLHCDKIPSGSEMMAIHITEDTPRKLRKRKPVPITNAPQSVLPKDQVDR